MIKKENTKIVIFICASLGALLFIYTLYRAIHNSFTHDEAETYILYVSNGASFEDIISMKYITANNHILNTLCMAVCNSIFGGSEISLRSPNLIAHLLYMAFSILWLLRFKNNLITISGFIILNFNPYLLDFFSLARGYGLAIGIMMMSVYFFSRYADNKKVKWIYLSFLCSILSVAANIALLHFFMSLLVAYNLCIMVEIRKLKIRLRAGLSQFFKLNIPTLIALLALFSLMYEPIRKLLVLHQFYFGGNTGFWTDTIGSMITTFIYNPSPSAFDYILVKDFIIVSCIVVIIFLAWNIIKNKGDIWQKPLGYCSVFIFVAALSSVIDHYLLGSNFLVLRTALFMVPLFLILIISMLHFGIATFSMKYLFAIAGGLLALGFVLNTVNNGNLKNFQEWQGDGTDKKAITEIFEDCKNKNLPDTSIRVSITWYLEPALNYYRTTKSYRFLKPLNRAGIIENADYYYVCGEDKQNLPKKDLRLIKYYPESGSSLYAAK